MFLVGDGFYEEIGTEIRLLQNVQDTTSESPQLSQQGWH